MKIKELNINGFGKLKNNNIKFDEGINVIIGENESGKSTLLKFITSSLYGVSKNKRGKNISDYEKYKPWDTENYSGKIKYKLDNENEFEVYRDFNKKSPEIYNNFGDDITALYNVGKNKEIPFFYEQTKIDEELFVNSTAVMQNDVRIDKSTQNMIIQKISNLATTGVDNISYKKSIEKLNKKQLEEIGSDRSQDRPINKINNELINLKNEKNNLEEINDEKYEIEKELKLIKNNLNNLENENNFLKKLKKIKNNYLIENQKIKLNKELIEEINNKINNLENEKEKINIKKINLEKIKINKYILINLFLLIIIFLINLFIKNNYFNFLYLILLIPFLIYFSKKIKIKNKNKKIIENNKLEINKINNEINLLLENKKEKINELNNLEINEENYLKKELENNYKEKINYLNIEDLKKDFLTEKIENKLSELNNKINEEKLKMHKLDLDKRNIFNKLDNLSKIEERIEYLNEEAEELKNKNDIIEIAKEYLNLSYKQMKENVTPTFSKELSNTIYEISNGKYKNVKITDNDIVVEIENGKYIPIDLLSTGTIDQLYFSLRMAILKEVTEEELPIFLDEAFVFYDKNRLINTINYLSKKLNKQIIIFSCTERELNILNNLNIKYNLIKI